MTPIPLLWFHQDSPERMRTQLTGSSSIPLFDFMGRTLMRTLLSTIRSLKTLGSTFPLLPTSCVLRLPAAYRPTVAEEGEPMLSKLLVYGTPGWGKVQLRCSPANDQRARV